MSLVGYWNRIWLIFGDIESAEMVPAGEIKNLAIDESSFLSGKS